MLNVLFILTAIFGLVAVMGAPYLAQEFRARRRLHHRLETLRRMRP